ncbi:MAG: hypothetical protein DRJ03_25135 [Chloroflexi bacterium]|nr:MAG: hypothetical protein DRJ03_25135 [Chloroflexota bacterium]
MSAQRQKRRNVSLLPLGILLVAFAIRIAVFDAIAHYPERFLQPDSHGYHRLAVNLVEQHRFGTLSETGDWQPEVNRTPLYPAFLALDYVLLGAKSPTGAVLVQILVSTLTVALAYRLGKLWGGRRVGVLVALVLSVEVGSVIYASQLMTETLFNCVLTASTLLWSLALRRRRWTYACVAGGLLGLGALVRPVLFYFGPVAAFLAWLLGPRRDRRRWQIALALLAAFALVIAPWMARNHTLTGRAELSTIQARNLVHYNLVQLRASLQGVSFSTASADLSQEMQQEMADIPQNPGSLAGYYQHKAFSEIRAHPVEYLAVHLKGSLLFFVIPTVSTVARALGWVRTTRTGLLANLMSRGLGDTWRAFQDFHQQLSRFKSDDWLFFGTTGYELLFLALVNLSALWGAIKCLRARRWDVLLLSVTAIAYFALVTGPVSYDARYRIPVTPFLVLLMAWGVARPHLSRRNVL